MDKNCDNCVNSGRPSYEWPCTACISAYGSDPSKWEGMVPATADMVEVVRCKDCKHSTLNCGDCSGIITMYRRDPVLELNVAEYIKLEHCSYGERKDNDCQRKAD